MCRLFLSRNSEGASSGASRLAETPELLSFVLWCGFRVRGGVRLIDDRSGGPGRDRRGVPQGDAGRVRRAATAAGAADYDA
jgi:hypothetical protein